MSVLQCEVSKLERLTDTVYNVEITPPGPVEFQAGQYLQVIMGENDSRAFSIASAPAEQNRLQLHIGAEPGNDYAGEVIQRMQATGKITVDAPLGVAFYQPTGTRPLILLAGGTGFSYAWSILQHHLNSSDSRPVNLYWGARQLADLYMHERLKQLAAQHENFTYAPVLEDPPSGWQYDRGLVHHAVLGHHKAELADFDIYVAGRFEMVRVIRDEFEQHGFPRQQLFGDALSFI